MCKEHMRLNKMPFVQMSWQQRYDIDTDDVELDEDDDFLELI